MEPEVEVLKTREEWLREEIRAVRTLMQQHLQWGVAILAAVEANLYYVRKDAHLIKQATWQWSHPLPPLRWLTGTLSLLILAFIFAQLLARHTAHHEEYRRQLIEMKGGYSSIEETIPIGGRIKWISFLFFLIPLFDFGLWYLLLVAKGELNFENFV